MSDIQPVIKLLTSAGVGSRREVARLIKEAKVTVNGEVIESFLYPVDRFKDIVAVENRPVKFDIQDNTYLVLNKPKGILTSTEDPHGNNTVIDILPDKYKNLHLFPVGRLDRETTGLVLLTNDGDLAYRLTHPRYEHKREYLVKIDGKLSQNEVSLIENGIELEDGITAPAKVKSVNGHFDYSIILHEGRKRQVRRMFAALGHQVRDLKRVRIGNLYLGDLREGEFRELSSSEVKKLKNLVFSKP